MDELEFLIEVMMGLPRQGPGCFEATRRAFGLMKNLPPRPKILDAGCGVGAQTLDLARLTDGEITALDLYRRFLDRLDARIAEKQLQGRVRTVQGSMDDMNFENESFDVIWSEGAIYNIGFRKGLEYWREFVKPGGHVAVSEAVWLTHDPPQPVRDFWNREYPAISGVENCMSVIRDCGYELNGHFTLPPSAWWDDFYKPMIPGLDELRRKYQGNEQAAAVFDVLNVEIEMFKKYSDCYSYEFFVMRRPD